MRRLGVVLLLCVASAAAVAEDADPLHEGQRDRGIALLEKVIADGDASPKDATKQQRVGRAHMLLDQNAKAVAAMERALALEPENARYAFWVGAAWLAVDVDKSVAAFERAIQLDLKDDHAWWGLGRARGKKEDLAGPPHAPVPRQLALLRS